MRSVKIGLFGLGTVGSGVVKIIKEHHDDFVRHAGVDLQLVATTARDIAEAERLGVAETYRTADEIFDDPDIDLIIELIGGTGFAREVIERALSAGKHVVTANKAVMAEFGEGIMHLADSNRLHLAFGASVGGGIPIIGPLKHSLTGNAITSVLGIVNGTTNFMLTRMAQDGLTYEAALAEAQERGFAEPDPTADVEGHDAAAKIAILSSIAFNSRVTIDQVPCEGITSIAPEDLKRAREMGYAIKLLAIANRHENGVEVHVGPTMIPLTHQLAAVNGVYNAIYVSGDSVGDVMFFGEGAGSGPAASAVMGDVIEVARYITQGVEPIVGCTCTDKLPLLPLSELVSKFYVRMMVEDRPGVLAETAATFAKHDVSISSMVQSSSDDNTAEIIYVMHETREADMAAALQEIAGLSAVREICTVIHVQG